MFRYSNCGSKNDNRHSVRSQTQSWPAMQQRIWRSRQVIKIWARVSAAEVFQRRFSPRLCSAPIQVLNAAAIPLGLL